MVSSSLGTTWRSDSRKPPVRILLSVYHIPSNVGLENVWQWHSKSTHFSLCSSPLYMWIVTFVRAWICTDDMWTSRLLLAYKQRDGEAISFKTLVWRSPGLPDLLYRPWHWGYLCSPSLPSHLCTFRVPSLDLFSICSTSLTVVKILPLYWSIQAFFEWVQCKMFCLVTLVACITPRSSPEDGPEYKTKDKWSQFI